MDVTKGKRLALDYSSFTPGPITIDDPAVWFICYASFLNGPSPHARPGPQEIELRRACKANFESYLQPGETVIGPEGTERMCRDLGVDPSDIAILVFAWRCGAKEMCEWSEEEFCSGLRAFGSAPPFRWAGLWVRFGGCACTSVMLDVCALGVHVT